MDPIVLFFIFGVFAALIKVNLRLPKNAFEVVSTLLLLTIGLKGGIELSHQNMSQLAPQAILVIMMGLTLPLVAYPILRYLGRLKNEDAASVAAHYGSVSVGTFAVTVAYLHHQNITFESYTPLFVVLLEIPAILVGIFLAKGLTNKQNWKALAHEVFCGKSVTLLLGGLVIGAIAGERANEQLGPLFFNLFDGFLALFLLEMGGIAASELHALKKHGAFLLGFGILMPMAFACVGAGIGYSTGLSVGGTTILAVLAASASYIAVPAAMRISVPEANPSLSLGASLGVTFPFNVIVGIPIYLSIAVWAHSLT